MQVNGAFRAPYKKESNACANVNIYSMSAANGDTLYPAKVKGSFLVCHDFADTMKHGCDVVPHLHVRLPDFKF